MKRICSVSVKTSNPRNIPRRLLSLALCGLLLLSAAGLVVLGKKRR